MTAALAFAFGYLLGSIPFGLLLTRAAGGPDIREIGSGNIGATNVLRTGNKVLAVATLLCDMLKGSVAVLAAARYGADPTIAAALGAFLGHLFPVWLKFKGGKGVATYIGLLIGLHWPAALFFCIVWLVVAGATRYSSLAALVASALTPSPSGTSACPVSRRYFCCSPFCCGSCIARTSRAFCVEAKEKSARKRPPQTKPKVVFPLERL